MSERIDINLRIDEIAKKLENGMDVSAIKLECMPKWNMCEWTIRRYVALAKDVVSGRMHRREALVAEVRNEIITREAEEWLKSSLELEARLCAITDGNVAIEREVICKDGTVKTLKRKPSIKEIIDAIDILLRLRGMYRPLEKKNERDEEIEREIAFERQQSFIARIKASFYPGKEKGKEEGK